jgi:hypothetical protein
MARSVKPPADLSPRGAALWRSCLRQDDTLGESDNPMREMLLEACRQADHLDALQEVCDRDGLMIETAMGPKVNPAFVELNKGRSLLARLIVSLRLPDEASGRRPQRRGMTAPRSAQKPGGRKQATNVTSLDRARRAAGGS